MLPMTTHTHTHLYKYAHLHMHIYIYIYIYIYMPIHTHRDVLAPTHICIIAAKYAHPGYYLLISR